MKKKYKLVVHTDQYSGNFECEMCAFITGDDSERSRGRKYVQHGMDYSILDDLIMSEYGEYGTSSVEIYPTPGWSNNGYGFLYKVGDVEGGLERFKKEKEKGRIGKSFKTPTPEELSIFCGDAYQSIIIHLSEKPTDEQLGFMKTMAFRFPEAWRPEEYSAAPKEPLNILGVDLLEISIEERLTPVP